MQQASDGKAGAALTAPRRRRCLTLPVVVLVMHNWLPVMLQVRGRLGAWNMAHACSAVGAEEP
jgi:hypothetical protein